MFRFQDQFDLFVDELSHSTGRLLIVSPYIKLGAIERLVGLVSRSCELSVYTQWNANDIATGVSDLGVYDLISNRQCGSFFLCPKLHAKYYRADQRYWFGSANLTSSGLSLGVSHPNLEILSTPSDFCQSGIAFEELLDQRSVRVTKEMRDEMNDLVSQIQSSQHFIEPDDQLVELERPALFGQMFFSQNPEDFFSWVEGDTKSLSDQEIASAELDYVVLKQHCPTIVPELAVQVAKNVLLQMPIFHDVVSKFNPSDGRWVGFGEVKEFLLRKHKDLPDNSAATVILQATMAWAVYLFPSRYEIYQYNVSQQLRRKS